VLTSANYEVTNLLSQPAIAENQKSEIPSEVSVGFGILSNSKITTNSHICTKSDSMVNRPDVLSLFKEIDSPKSREPSLLNNATSGSSEGHIHIRLDN